MLLADLSHINGHKIDWGSVPVWVGAVLTGGSLLLGFYLMLRDRRMDEQEQARMLACYLTNINEEPAIALHNASTINVTSVTVTGYAYPRGLGRTFAALRSRGDFFGHVDEIEPGRKIVKAVRVYGGDKDVVDWSIYNERTRLQFIDGYGNSWTRMGIGEPLRRGFREWTLLYGLRLAVRRLRDRIVDLAYLCEAVIAYPSRLVAALIAKR
ncbi:hypothetical protein ACI8AC_15205 [Geodermatophilus sp. SYSU D00758]